MPESQRARTLIGWLLTLVAGVVLLLLVEGVWRGVGFVRTGTWPLTKPESYKRFVESIGSAYERHPYYLVRGRPGAGFVIAGHQVSFNSRGHRGGETAMPKPPGRFRVICLGGSTTFDLRAADDASTWPSLLAAKLGSRFDVVNAGFAGWTTVESLSSLALREIDLAPDLIIVFAGLNDLQPGSHRPLARDYVRGHADVLPQVLGVDPVHIRFASRFLFIEWLLDQIAPGRDDREGYSPAWGWNGGKRDRHVSQESVDVFRRNLRSIIAVGRSAGADVLVVAQGVRLRQNQPGDRAYVESWIPGLTSDGIVDSLRIYNTAASEVARAQGVRFLDPFESGAFSDADFADPYHFSRSGSGRFAASLEPLVREVAAAR
ncbi:MAG: SGNH/GDSL hydrolase family protein [Thermoanaerobaculia bacterium]